MAKNTTTAKFGGNNAATVAKTDADALVAWSPLQILRAGDLNGFIAWAADYATSASNEIANALAAFSITPNPTLFNQLAGLLKDLDDKISNAATSGAIIGSYWFGKTQSATVVPNPDLANQNYFDFTTNTPYTAKADLTGWDAGTPIVPPDDRDARIIITSRFIDLPEGANNGGTAYWAYLSTAWSYFPSIGSWVDVNLTGTPTAPNLTSSSPNNQVANKAAVLDAQKKNSYQKVVQLGELTAENNITFSEDTGVIYCASATGELENIKLNLTFPDTAAEDSFTFELQISVGGTIPTIDWGDTPFVWKDGAQAPIGDANAMTMFVLRKQGGIFYANVGGMFK